jgi:hypothetical protein
MPSRLGVGFILLFWLTTTAHVVYHDVWPRLFSDAPPPVGIDLTDEAAQVIPTRWKVYRGDEPIGTLSTQTSYLAADDTFRFTNTYQKLSFDFATVAVEFPRLETAIRVTRAGDLREQTMTGELKASAKIGPVMVPVGDASADVKGMVTGGQLVGTCVIRQPAGATTPAIERALEPVPVPAGQVLNPMSPVSRLRDVRPGQRWVIQQVDPLRESLTILFREVLKSSAIASTALPQQSGNKELVAEVLRTPEKLDRPGKDPVECWVIEYRGEGVQAKTWVSREDGRVMRQEASGYGERLRFERDE